MRAILLLLVCSSVVLAEDFHFEITANYWPLNPTGSVHTPSNQVDLHSDLGIQGRKSEALLQVAVKPGRKHRLNFELAPYRFNGRNTVTRTFTLGGVQFAPPPEPIIQTQFDINYFFGGYQYDIVNTSRGHIGAGAGIAYFDAKATAVAPFAVVGIEERNAPLPVAEAEFRYFVVPGKRLVNVNGEAKGMSLGSYGQYVQGNINAGFAVTEFVRLQGGFSIVDADVHDASNARGFKFRFAGPIFSIQLHD